MNLFTVILRVKQPLGAVSAALQLILLVLRKASHIDCYSFAVNVSPSGCLQALCK